MNDIVSPILQWLNAHPHLSGLGTFIISAAESIAIIGTIIPGSVMMTAIGALAGAGVIPLWSTVIWAILGAIVGDGISYWVGHYFKDRLHYVWPFRSRPELLKKGEAFFDKYGGMSVFIGRFVGPVRALVPLVAGMLGMKPFRFYLANILSAIGWAPAYMLPGILLGAASLELPPDIAVHAMLIILLVTLFIILCIWFAYKIFILINNQINNFLNRIWMRLRQSRYFRPITTVLKHYNPSKTHGQLTLAFYFILVCSLFSSLALYVAYTGSQTISINNSMFYLFRSLRTPLVDQIMIAITFLGEKLVLLPLCLTLFAWLGYTKRWRTAWHVLALGVLSAISIELFKHLVQSPRPWGIQQSPDGSSFPSGHSTLAMVFYLGIGLLLAKAFNPKYPRFIYRFAFFIILLVGISRLYLGAHWFTDVLGAWLLGTAILSVVILSYHRKAELPLHPKGIFFTIFLTLTVTYTTVYCLKVQTAKIMYSQINWPIEKISLATWWDQKQKTLPRYRVNRFGFSNEVLNIQWLASLNDIEKILLQNGWQIPAERDLITVLHRLSDVRSSEHLPLVSPLYLDKKPSLVLIKYINGNRKFVVLRLWNSNLVIQDSTFPLWVGVVSMVPRTYSWIFNHKKTLDLTPETLFTSAPKQYIIKKMNIRTNKKNQTIIFIKPK